MMVYDCLVFYSSPKELFFQPLQQHHCIASIIRSLFAREPPSAIALWTRLGDAVASYWCGTLYYAVGASSLGSLSWPTSPIGTRIMEHSVTFGWTDPGATAAVRLPWTGSWHYTPAERHRRHGKSMSIISQVGHLCCRRYTDSNSYNPDTESH